jgi:hypothetical protein
VRSVFLRFSPRYIGCDNPELASEALAMSRALSRAVSRFPAARRFDKKAGREPSPRVEYGTASVSLNVR